MIKIGSDKTLSTPKLFAILAVALALLPNGSTSAKSRQFDPQLAVELSIAYLRFNSRHPGGSPPPGIDYKHPVVSTAVDSKRREFVFVSFTSDRTGWGAYATFQVCHSNPALMPADIGTVDNIAAYRATAAKVNLTVDVALDSVCPFLST